jgi:hypothetical protein
VIRGMGGGIKELTCVGTEQGPLCTPDQVKISGLPSFLTYHGFIRLF